ncbi:hypothetical protein JTB14_017770 [Gonioctena quinquepunctata]|nr:hypothetical protein JTB14_017770 [Gonioctena quinquepunctata]
MEPRGRASQGENLRPKFFNQSGPYEWTGIIRKVTVTHAQVFNKKLGSLLRTGVFLEETTDTRGPVSGRTEPHRRKNNNRETLRDMQIRIDGDKGMFETSQEFDVGSFVNSPTNSMFDSELIDENADFKYFEDARADNYSNILEGVNMLALIDTGASANFVRADMLPKEVLSQLKNPVRVQLGCVANSSTSLGSIMIGIEIEEKRYQIRATVLTDLNEAIILGMPFVSQFEAIMDFAHKCIYFGKSPNKLCSGAYQQKGQHCKWNPEFGPDQFSEETREAISRIVNKFPDVFEETIKQPITQASLHDIIVKEERPYRQFRYDKMSEMHKNIVHEEIAKFLKRE